MATFTPVPEDTNPSISVHPKAIISTIDKNIYGGFTEFVFALQSPCLHSCDAEKKFYPSKTKSLTRATRHMGRCIYGGIYDPGNPLSDENGFRRDVIDAFKELNCPVVRYPGGNFVATYHWLDGVGPRENRPARPELAWIGTESNEFGTDEFMKWCEIVGTEPYLCLNFGTALGWVEYCNSDRNSYYANLRRKNGREKPYNVRYWALGNEMWGPWQVCQMTKEDYAKKAYQWAKAIKLLDPSVELILCGENGSSSWDSYVIKECIKFDRHCLGGSATASLIDQHSIHIYTAGPNHYTNVT
ncbi:hypothetical protein E4U43_007085, partial [Claviceps pusilla]